MKYEKASSMAHTNAKNLENIKLHQSLAQGHMYVYTYVCIWFHMHEIPVQTHLSAHKIDQWLLGTMKSATNSGVTFREKVLWLR